MKGISSQAAVHAYQRVGVNPVAKAQPAQQPSELKEQSVRQDPGAAKVSISKEARALATENEARLDTQKVETLRSQVETGTYQVDASRIAARVLGLG